MLKIFFLFLSFLVSVPVFAAGDAVPLAKIVNGRWRATDPANSDTVMSENTLKIYQFLNQGKMQLSQNMVDWPGLASDNSVPASIKWLRYTKGALETPMHSGDTVLFPHGDPRTTYAAIVFLAQENRAKDLVIQSLIARITALEPH